MTPKFRRVLEEALDRGIAYGLRRAYKHRSDGPDEETMQAVKEAIHDAVDNELYEWFEFPQDLAYEEE